ncbi:peptide chain release factor N(5)-glutamine methyltransferase [Sulfurimonas paralvinellae]|uniref:peptide chain release factor N(5)-glutamine methyltransferase n=1 Tax=Sulfurimonas paralvinellae TaxID=317658 RepID=A0A7M1BAY7_9BACT|nr:peptide chain release factor N(5)-glutamine methyltransferase [Sulfurimonas paralvinellae]QOP45998.1 peptide chain release factor N(5)-glutamine methyltransferase [Sulfurimonas paralvinellae]
MRSRYIVSDLLREATEKITQHSIERALREAQLLFMAFFEKDELWLISHQKDEIEVDESFFHWVERRCASEPFEYIVNRVSFYSEEFYIDEGALIPRPETEILIDEIEKNIADKTAKITFVEVGVGSGIISIMLAKKFPNAMIIAVDISPKALAVAHKNIEKFALQERIELREGSLLEPISETIDYLVSNPPYIANDAPLASNLSYEPQNALFGGEVGDEIIQQLLDEVLKQKIRFFSCEMGYDQKSKIQNYLKDKEFSSLEFYKDYASFDRGFTLKV